tara:strand:+ start:27644 stop:27805 length:162 start_codon:yes stop_codon:yes gene_type:complete
MAKKHKLDQIGYWAKENQISKWIMFHPDEAYRKKENFVKKDYNSKKRYNKYDN